MARQFFSVEKGIEIVAENTDSGVQILFGAAVPGGQTETDNAPQGSVYMRTAGEFYSKKTAGAGADKWVRQASLDDLTALSWRSETVRATTGDVAPATSTVLDLTATPFGDDDTPFLDANDFSVNDHIIFGAGGTPKLMRVSVVSVPDITVVDAANPLVDNNMLISRNYLPDSPDDQEKQVIVLYNGTDIIKLADFNFAVATGINLSAGYTPASGDISTGEVLESAIEKLDGNTDALLTAIGIAQGALHFGTFTGDIISDNNTLKPILQQLETEIENLEGQRIQDGVTAAVVLDEFDVDAVLLPKWLVYMSLDSDPARNKAIIVEALHNGHSGGDASTADDTQYAKLKNGAAFNTTITVELTGVGAAQKIQLKVAASVASSFRSMRLGFVEANGI